MSLDTVRLFEHAHGHIGWLAAALLVHPAIVLRDRQRRAHLAVALATVFTTGGAAIGLWLYVAYRARLKQGIFADAPSIGLLFERKEHLAFGAVLLSWAGCVAYVAAQRATGDVRDVLRTLAFRAFVVAAGFAVVVAVLGTVVAVHSTF